MTMFGLFRKTDALELTLRGVTYTVEADLPLRRRRQFVRLRITADDGRRWTMYLGDGRGLSAEERRAMQEGPYQALARAAGRLSRWSAGR